MLGLITIFISFICCLQTPGILTIADSVPYTDLPMHKHIHPFILPLVKVCSVGGKYPCTSRSHHSAHIQDVAKEAKPSWDPLGQCTGMVVSPCQLVPRMDVLLPLAKVVVARDLYPWEWCELASIAD